MITALTVVGLTVAVALYQRWVARPGAPGEGHPPTPPALAPLYGRPYVGPAPTTEGDPHDY